MQPLIKVNNLHKVYQLGGEEIRALDGVDLSIEKGEIVTLLGPSGSGKSTLLNALAGLERPDFGNVEIGNFNLNDLSEVELTHFRSNNIGFVFQAYNLINTLSALENVTLGLIFKGVSKTEREQLAVEILNRVGLSDRLRHKPNQLSGGQQQRVSIARAFAGRPKIIFADEPTGNLDTATSLEVLHLMSDLVHEHGQTLIMVTHDIEMTATSDRILHMRDGRIEKRIKVEHERKL